MQRKNRGAEQMSEIKWTPQQLEAIEGSGGNILVSAAAGSGKTAVLAQRVLHRIAEQENPVDADSLLVVTFSNAAAGEMKQRISKKLWELNARYPGNRWLMRQQLLLDSAQISTIHSFCIHLLRSNFHLLELPADFRIGDERELEVLRMETAHEVIAKQYDSGEPVFLDLVELLSSSRSDTRLESAVLKLYGFLRNHPFYSEWLDSVISAYGENIPLEQSQWFPIIMDYASDAIGYCCDVMQSALAEMQHDEPLLNAYGGAFANDLVQLRHCRGNMAGGGWDECRKLIASITFGGLGRLSGYPDEGRKKRFQAIRTGVKKIVSGLCDRVFLLSSQQYSDDVVHLTPIVRKLFQIVTEFDRLISAAKLQKNMLDFTDLEHYTLELLYDSKDGIHTPSAVAASLRQRYNEILIDEYQDTNGTQEMIFRALESENGNRFLVGDVKQSIYRFRQARPENFLEKKNSYTAFDGRTFPAKIALSANFRTRRETTGIINFIFGMVMSRKIGEMEYGSEDALISAGSYDYSTVVPVNLLITDTALLPDEEVAAAEAGMTATEIKKLIDSGIATPGDICILLRSPKNKAGRYADALANLGIRCWSDRQDGFLAAREIAPVISYLKILANPLLDLELSQVLCSYLYGFTSDMLAQLRLIKGKSLFASLCKKAETDKTCGAFCEDFRLLRQEAVSRPASGIIQLVYALTGAEHKTLAMQQGEGRRGNLRLLAEYAADYGNGTDLSGFLSYLYSLEEYECDLPSATVAAGNAVSIMSIHKSKGLEFPVVFLCDTAAQFNTMDLTSDVLMHPELGFACVVRDNRKMSQHRTVQLSAMALENKRAMLSEELRVLYVALTRAKERLYITAADKKLSHLSRGAASPLQKGRLPAWTVRSAGCYLDWIAAALCHHPDFPEDLLTVRTERLLHSDDIGSLAVRLILPECVEKQPKREIEDAETPDNIQVERLKRRMHWEYPYTADTLTPVKLSVSQLTKGKGGKEFYFTRRPKLLTQKSLTPTERGIAAHKFMQFANFAAAGNDPSAELERLTRLGFLTEEEGRFVDVDSLKGFFASDIGKRLLASENIYREIRFMREFTPEELAVIDPEYVVTGNTVVQGVADCVIVENGAGTIVDYKTDNVKDMQQLISRYRGQLRLYKYILEGLLEISIEKCIIYSFALGEEIDTEI